MRLIDADALKIEIDNLLLFQKWIREEIKAHIDNVPTVEERPQGDCENCDFRKFTETFVGGVVEIMNKNGITSVEQLQEILKGGAE